MDTDSFIVYLKTEDIFEDIAKNFEKRFDASSYESESSLPNGKKAKTLLA